MDLTTGEVTDLAGDGSEGSRDGPGATARFSNPVDLAVTSTTVYVVDEGNTLICAVDRATKAVATFAGSSERASVDGVGRAAGFKDLCWLCLSSDGSALLASDGGSVRKIVLASNYRQKIALINMHLERFLGPKALVLMMHEDWRLHRRRISQIEKA